MTMSQILRRTKKCCLKLFRKLSINNGSNGSGNGNSGGGGGVGGSIGSNGGFAAGGGCGSSSMPSKLNNGMSHTSGSRPKWSTKYVQHKNKNNNNSRTPSRGQVVPSPALSWNLQRSEENSTTFDDITDDEEQPRSSGAALKLQRFTFDNSARYLRVPKNNKNANEHSPPMSRTMKIDLSDDEIVFTENRIYVGVTEKSMTDDNQTNVDKMHHFGGGSQDSVLSNGAMSNWSTSKREFDCDNSHNYEEVLFERVKYSENKKYLHNSPGTSSTDSRNLSRINILDDFSTSTGFDELSDYRSCPTRPFSSYDNVQADGDERKNPWQHDANGNLWENDANDPWNSIDRKRTSFDPWASLRGRIFERDWTEARRTSSSTLETWIDDEVFDNSFNEELEKRCSCLGRR